MPQYDCRIIINTESEAATVKMLWLFIMNVGNDMNDTQLVILDVNLLPKSDVI